ncbi:cytochrome c biogenesis heme-transporting ATPase CcmA [Roseateles sp. BYS96W]|uniref:Cytochrome c biogenesis heme-transporting ATPase CcmA n=1 Tax=Pelomonas nitida TaxID=3299027 RepID=A0ABW7GCS9_9BURK
MPSHENAAPLLQVQSLACRRGGRSLFKGLSFELHAGQALELHGANGSGKTSLLRLLAGLMPAAAGAACWQGRPQDVAYLGHLNGLSPDLSALENLRFAQQLVGGDTAAPVAALQDWGMTALATRPVRRLSQGQQRRVALARLGLARQRLWLLDEPCAGLDDAGERLFDARLAAHLADGGLAVVATHQPLRLPADRCRALRLGQAAAC